MNRRHVFILFKACYACTKGPTYTSSQSQLDFQTSETTEQTSFITVSLLCILPLHFLYLHYTLLLCSYVVMHFISRQQ